MQVVVKDEYDIISWIISSTNKMTNTFKLATYNLNKTTNPFKLYNNRINQKKQTVGAIQQRQQNDFQ